jgi:outer membrane protein
MTPFGLIKYAAILLTAIAPLFAQSPPVSSAQPWHSVQERQIAPGPRSTYSTLARIEPDKIYSLAELIDFAEAHNPETRVAWENARAQAAALGVARSELFPTVAAVALASEQRKMDGFGSQYYRQTVTDLETSLNLTYTITRSAGGKKRALFCPCTLESIE